MKLKILLRSSSPLALALVLALTSATAHARGFGLSGKEPVQKTDLPPANIPSDLTAQLPDQSKIDAVLKKADIEADSITYDKDTQDVVAEGNAVLLYNNAQMKADKISYNQDTHLITSNTGVEYKDAKGTIYKAKAMDVTDKFDKGQLTDVSAMMKGGANFRSDNLTIVNADRYNIDKIDYSPCKVCKDGKYIFSLQAKEAVYDTDAGSITYHDVYLKVFDHKVFYTPWLSSPTPSAKSKSGFLAPKFGQSSDYGFYTQIPYYWQVRSNLDFTFAPLITTGDGPILIGQVRNLLENGYYEMELSGADTPKLDSNGNRVQGSDKQFRGHHKIKGDFTFGDNWSWGVDSTRATDDTYLKRYKLGTYEDVLTSRIYTNWISQRDYFSAEALSFQDTRPGATQKTTPWVAPLIQAGKTMQVSDDYNQKFTADLNTMSLQRGIGVDSDRATGAASWSADYLSNSGQLFNLKLTNRVDYYNVNDVPYLSSTFAGGADRYIPTASLTWSFPLQKVGQSYGLVFEPVSMLVVSSNGNNNPRIPNEDSINSELEDYNLFEENHASGYDLVEDGTRVNYGVRGIITTQSVGDYNFLLGQIYRTNTDAATFAPQTGLDKTFSDYVGRVSTTGKLFSSSYRFLLDKDNARFKRNEIGTSLNVDPINLGTSYTFIDNQPGAPARQELSMVPSIKITDDWNVHGTATRNMDNDSDAGWIGFGGGVTFTNDCFNSTLDVSRAFVHDQDIQPSTTIKFKFVLKNFGG